MFWGCIFYNGMGTLVSVEENMNTEKHIPVLDDNLWPVIADTFQITSAYFRRAMHCIMFWLETISGNWKMI